MSGTKYRNWGNTNINMHTNTLVDEALFKLVIRSN